MARRPSASRFDNIEMRFESYYKVVSMRTSTYLLMEEEQLVDHNPCGANQECRQET